MFFESLSLSVENITNYFDVVLLSLPDLKNDILRIERKHSQKHEIVAKHFT